MTAAAASADQTPGHLGFKGTVAALAVGQLLVWAVLYYGFSSLVLPMKRDTGWGEATLMGAFTLGLGTWGLASYAVGAAIDAGRGRAVLTWGAVLGAIGCAGWSQVTQPWMLYAVFALLGVASAMLLYEPAFAVLTKRYPTRYPDGIMALTLVAGFASTLSFPAIAGLFKAGLDWRQTLLVLAAVMLATAPLHAWCLRGPALVAAPAHVDEAADATLRQALHQSSFWLMTLCFTLVQFSQAALWAHVMPAFAAKGVSSADGLLVVMAVGPAQVAGRLLYAWIGRGWSPRVLGGVVLATLPVSMLLFAFGHSLALLLPFAILFGLANGLVTIVRGGLVPLYWGRAHVGRISGLMSAIGQVARATAPLLTAWLLLAVPGYQAVILVLVLLGVVAFASFWRAGPPG